MAVRTGGAGMGGLSLLLLERSMPGIDCRLMKMQGAWGSGTTYVSQMVVSVESKLNPRYVTFDNVKVPVENLIGKEGSGFKYIMYK